MWQFKPVLQRVGVGGWGVSVLLVFRFCISQIKTAMFVVYLGPYSCHDNSYAAGSVLIMTKISRYYLKQGSSTPTNLMGRVKTIWEPCVFRARPTGSL